MAPPEPPPYSAPGLLEGIADNALDDDYYEVRRPQGKGNATVITGIGLALFALLVTVASVQNRNDRPADRLELNTLITNIQNRKATIEKRDAQADKLRAEVAGLNKLSNRTNPEFEALRATAADVAATGSGIVITADNSAADRPNGRITDSDLQLLVNGLWYAGADAIAINGSRLGTLTSIRSAGSAITVNFRSISAPYTIKALGDADSLTDRLAGNPGGRYWARRVAKSGLRFAVDTASRITVPAAPGKRVTITHATAIEGDS